MEIGPVGHSVMKVSCLTPSCYCRHVVVYIYIYISCWAMQARASMPFGLKVTVQGWCLIVSS